MNTGKKSANQIPAQTIEQLEAKYKVRSRKWSFSLARFIVVTNLIGLSFGVIAITQGAAILIAFVAIFLLPLGMFLIIGSIHLYEWMTGKPFWAIPFRPKKNDHDTNPFAD